MTSAGIINTAQHTKAAGPHVRFTIRSVKDPVASQAAGYEVAKDEYYATINAPGSRDSVDKPVDQWLEEIKQKARNGDQFWTYKMHEAFTYAFSEFKKGNEVPPFGTPIRGTLLLQPTEQRRCIDARILTIEDLAEANEGAISQIGMGARAMKEKAIAWLKTRDESGSKLAIENQALRVEVEQLTAALESANGKIKQLESELSRKK